PRTYSHERIRCRLDSAPTNQLAALHGQNRYKLVDWAKADAKYPRNVATIKLAFIVPAEYSPLKPRVDGNHAFPTGVDSTN
ncbi:MAG: hypothetical protein NT154_20460, partial [Verrucomicrobia bacterium]|nr:hypothetical protein [Verrucomicrobiota bacterium]